MKLNNYLLLTSFVIQYFQCSLLIKFQLPLFSNLSLFIDVQKFLFNFIHYLRVIDNFFVDVKDGLVEIVELIFIDVRGDVCFVFLLFGKSFLAFYFFTFLSLFLFGFFNSLSIFSFKLLFGPKILNNFFKTLLLSSFFNF